MIRTIALSFLVAVAVASCGQTLENAAAKDPQKCERDPKCKKNDKANAGMPVANIASFGSRFGL